MRIVGLDIHRVFAEAVVLDSGKVVRLGRIGMTREHLEAFARRLSDDDHVVVEATGNATAAAEVIRPHVGRVAIANPRQVRLIAEARIKTDVIDATVLARLDASGFLPEVWVPDQNTLALRRQVTRRNQIVRQRARLKTIIQSILHACDLELRSGQPARRGQRGMACDDNLSRVRREERRRAEQAETAYKRLTEAWTRRGRRAPAGAASEERP